MGKYFDATGLSLVRTSDQLIENMHQFVHKMMSRSNSYVKHVENPHHGQLLFKAVQHLNCMNIYIRNKQYLNLYLLVFPVICLVLIGTCWYLLELPRSLDSHGHAMMWANFVP